MDPKASPPPSSSGSSSAASTADLAPLSEQAQAPPRRRLVKASTRTHLDDSRKRDAAGAGSAPPGFAPPGFGGSVVVDRDQNATFMTNATSSVGPTSTPSSSVMAGNVASGFRDRDRGGIRLNNKDFAGDYQASLLHGSSKPGRPPHVSSPAGIEPRPLGRRAEGLRRHDSSAQKHGEEIKMQQAKRAALVRAQQAGATGSFKSCDSHFNNFLVPVIPIQFLSKSQSHSAEMG